MLFFACIYPSIADRKNDWFSILFRIVFSLYGNLLKVLVARRVLRLMLNRPSISKGGGDEFKRFCVLVLTNFVMFLSTSIALVNCEEASMRR